MDDRQSSSTAEDPVATSGKAAPLSDASPNEFKIVLLFCCFAAIHVFIFCAAFPFFNNVDEPIHFDLVLRYSHGLAPHGRERILPESVEYIAFYTSWAYYAAPAEFAGGEFPPPLWTEPPDKKRQDFEANCQRWQFLENYEVSQPPLYYVTAGGWWQIGKLFGIHGGRLLYWLRFFNIVQVVVLVWLSYAIARLVFPDKLFVRVAVPALVAVMPQTAFYSIGNDVTPALFFGVTFVCLLRWFGSERLRPKLAAMTGLAFAATYLSKSTTLPLLVVAAAFTLFKLQQLARRQKGIGILWPVAAFSFCATVPILTWMIWCKFRLGDLTGAKLKMEHFGWTIKPFAMWLDHPIFTPSGFWTYLSGQLSTFWQGEFQWHHQPLMLPGSTVIYAISALVLLMVAVSALIPEHSNITSLQRRALGFSLICFTAEIGFFAFMSIVYDFHDCPYPSRQYPYFTSGRLLLGALIPFLILIAFGFDRLLKRSGTTTKFLVLGIIISLMLAGEIVTDRQVFSDPYNWFHLP